MFNLVVEEGNNNRNLYNIKEYSATLNDDNISLVLSFTTSNDDEIKYLIHKDTRANDIKLIKKHLDEEYEKAVKDGIPYEINEYPERHYIYVGNENLKQYTGIRI